MENEEVFYFGSFEDACSFVRQFEEKTNTRYVTKKKKKSGFFLDMKFTYDPSWVVDIVLQ